MWIKIIKKGDYKNTKIKKKKKKKMSIISKVPIFVDTFRNNFISQGSFFFLTHAHEDHMKGLRNFNGLVYCSRQTKTLLKKMQPFKRVSTKFLTLDEWIVFPFGKVKAFSVTHCVGALGFIFCLNDGRNVLHTGDFRGGNGFIDYLDSKTDGILFSKVLFDNTFGDNSEKYQEFPSIVKSASLVEKVVESSNIENPQVHLIYNGKIGMEYLAMQLQKKKKIHYPFLSKFLPQSFYTSTDDADFHINDCGCIFEPDKLIKIYLSARAFDTHGSFIEVQGKNTFRICYSMHSSYKELEMFLLWVEKNKDLEGCEIVKL
jgi:hypothetical protein